MAKFLSKVSFTPEGTKGLLKEGASGRRAMVDKMIKELGGSVEAFYYAFGETDLYGIFNLPDSVTAAAMSLVINAAGAVKITMTPLLSVEEIDQARKKSVAYRPPGA